MTLTTGAKRVAIIVALAWMVAPFGGGAMAADRGRGARAHITAARAYFNLEKYREAIGEYEQAYLDKQDPSYFFEIAECHRALSNLPEAERFYRRFLQDAPRGHASRAAAEARLAEIADTVEKARQAELERQAAASSPPGAPPGSRPLPPSFPPSAHYLAPLPTVATATRVGSRPPSGPTPTPVASLPGRPAPPASPALGPQPASWHTGHAGPAASAQSIAAAPLARGDATGLSSSTPVSTAPSPEPVYGPPTLALPASQPSADRPFYGRWWFWTLVGGVVAGGVVAGLVVSSSAPSRPSCPAGVSCQ